MAFEQDGGNFFGFVDQVTHDDQPNPLSYGLPTFGGSEILNDSEKQPTQNLFDDILHGRDPLPQHSEDWQRDNLQSLVGVTSSIAHNPNDNTPHASSMSNNTLGSLPNIPIDLDFGPNIFGADIHYQLFSAADPSTAPSIPQQAPGAHAPVSYISPASAVHQPPQVDFSHQNPYMLAQHHDPSHLPHHDADIEAANSLTSLNPIIRTPHSQQPSTPQPPQTGAAAQASESYEGNFALMTGAMQSSGGQDMRMPARENPLVFGTDGQFTQNPYFMPHNARETSQILNENQKIVVMNALHRIPSNATTRQSSPVPGVKSPGSIVSPGHGAQFKTSGPPNTFATSSAPGNAHDSSAYSLDERPAKRRKTPPVTAGSNQPSDNGNNQEPMPASGKGKGRARAPRSRNKQQKPKKTALTPEEKRRNHNESERRRREIIAKGFEEMRIIRPGVNAQSDSKSDLINDTAKWLRVLIANNKRLQELAKEHGVATNKSKEEPMD
ncbi:hypothetical protein MKZ38_009769 [Zalerion maritima]|uniref:BHLH domain-containing protein n=1 Tax=Zalerion maritima TaxID=339359 RepID=A0AAD5WXC6_9PEZI|nr:hypothetical protein MKZ38_009769 [Zalerion maritima]